MDQEQTGTEIELLGNQKDGLPLEQLEAFLSDLRYQPIWRPEAQKADDYYDGHQLTAERLARFEKLGIPPLITNLIAPAINVMLGLEAKSRTDWRVTQENEVQEVPEEMMDAMNAKLNEAERESRADRAISDAHASQLKSGLGWVEVSINSDVMGYRYRVDSVHRDEIWWDWRSKSPDLTDSRYLIRKRAFDKDILLAMMPEHKDLISWAIDDRFRTWQWDVESRIDTTLAYAAHLERVTNIDAMEWRNSERKRATLFEVWYRKWMRSQVFRLPSGKVMLFNKADPMQDIAARQGKIKPFMAPFSETRMAIYMGCHRLYDFKSPYSHRHFPYVPFWGYREGTSRVPYGLIRAMISPQDVVNSSDSKMQHMLSSRRLRADSDAIDTKYNSWAMVRENLARSDSIVLLDPAKPNSRFREDNEDGLTQQQFQRRLQAAGDIRAAGGVFNQDVAQGNGVTSGVGLNTLIENGSLATVEINDNYQFARRQVGELLFSLVRDDLVRDEIPVMVKKDGKKQLVVLNQRTPEGIKNPVAQVPIKVVLEDLPSTPAFRQQQLAMVTEMVKSLPQEYRAAVIELWVGLTDVPEREKVLERVRKIAGIQPDMTPEQELAAQKQAAEKQAAIEAAAMKKQAADTALVEAKAAQTAAAVKSTEAKTLQDMVTAIYVALQAGQTIAGIPQVAPVADEILKGAGYKDNPQGQDPNIPQAEQSAGIQPGQDMSPAHPRMAAGATKGIETVENDGIQNSPQELFQQ